jgi:hypothetical protein
VEDMSKSNLLLECPINASDMIPDVGGVYQ